MGILLPGGGQYMLGDLDEARGILTSFSLLMLSGVWGSISIMKQVKIGYIIMKLTLFQSLIHMISEV